LICTYCGILADSLDHVIPVSWETLRVHESVVQALYGGVIFQCAYVLSFVWLFVWISNEVGITPIVASRSRSKPTGSPTNTNAGSVRMPGVDVHVPGGWLCGDVYRSSALRQTLLDVHLEIELCDIDDIDVARQHMANAINALPHRCDPRFPGAVLDRILEHLNSAGTE